MGFDGFYLNNAPLWARSYPSSLSPSVHHVMKHYSHEFYLHIVLQRRVGLLEDRCVCHANMPEVLPSIRHRVDVVKEAADTGDKINICF